MIAATERAGLLAFKSSSLSSCLSAYSASNDQRLGRFELLGLMKRLGLLALLRGPRFCRHWLIYLLCVATAAGKLFGRQIALIANSRGSPALRQLAC